MIIHAKISLSLFLCLFCVQETPKEEWGFYGHRLLNEMAVFTLPEELIGFYKDNIDFLADHAVDPDKRRYASSFEAIRHYIDIDHWGEPPFESLPRDWFSALAKTTEASMIMDGDTSVLFKFNLDSTITEDVSLNIACLSNSELRIPFVKWRNYFIEHVIPLYYEEEWKTEASALLNELDKEIPCAESAEILLNDRLSEYGIVPWHLQLMQKRLQRAMEKMDVKKILRLSAEMGHYIGDAHVPLHTTLNYNGQLTDQVGIHAFWESRLPELFAEEEYDFFVGQAEYMDDKESKYWAIVLKSHSYVDSVLAIEKRLKESWPEDEIYCYDERLNRLIRTECRGFAKEYQEEMDGMVEERMRQTIHSIGSSWYSAWIDAGQPDLNALSTYANEDVRETDLFQSEEEIEEEGEKKKFRIRKHE